MASKLLSGGSDQEMLSQTETEDTDTGEVSSDNVTGTDASGASLTSPTSAESSEDLTQGHRNRKLTNVSVDLTDVTALEDNASQGEDSLCDDVNDGEEGGIHVGSTSDKQNSKKGTGLMDIDFSKDWYNHKCFKSYWQHYNQVMSWCQKHTKVCDKLRNKSAGRGTAPTSSWGPFSQPFYQNSFHMPSWNHPYNYNQYNSNKNTNVKRNSVSPNSRNACRSSHRKRKNKHRKQKSASSSEVTSCETQTETSEEFQMEISQDMIDFFAKTQAHRKERDEARKAEKDDEGVEPEHINVENVKVTETRAPTVEAPKERPGAKRTAEMKLLYGKGAPMIHGMETALQMTYDRNVDLKQPKTWPNMPLRVIFG
ncbi:gem-associated protein 8-like [Ruditapes philippinarum]|uniref:gem-associated protein 8-like n=1 Tax=Ruditapes philippinarum TaxID=129788 RepID=UPI00295B2A6C|nr:gem-associated protein 8-like [Ruditapes philippinarum]